MNPTPAPIRGEKTPKIPKPGSVCGDLWEKPPHAPNTGIHPWGKAGREPNAAICPQLLGENPPTSPTLGSNRGFREEKPPRAPNAGTPPQRPAGQNRTAELRLRADPQRSPAAAPWCPCPRTPRWRTPVPARTACRQPTGNACFGKPLSLRRCRCTTERRRAAARPRSAATRGRTPAGIADPLDTPRRAAPPAAGATRWVCPKGSDLRGGGGAEPRSGDGAEPSGRPQSDRDEVRPYRGRRPGSR